ncbi:HesA/MoeB/ThiF family protein [archaeon]|jgi:molybdopterin/thiamine biosynthesis adenylyltransferase|nr:HesA/MoeB/ThiF family protein [archaeon]MBT6697820.1 HesA/MoeB/ThiF family protein [archaeon]
MALTNIQKQRYSRQIVLKEIGISGQKALSTAHVTIVGAGALGSTSAEILLRAGVTNLTVIDRDIVELSNLQRQSLYTQNDVGKDKVIALKNHLIKINSLAKSTIIIHPNHLYKENIEDLIPKNTNLILDCTDNLQTRFLLDIFRQTVNKKKVIPWVFTSAIQTSGQISLITKKEISLESFLPKNAQGQTCSQVGVLGSTTHIIASYATNLAILFLTNNHKNLENKLISIDTFNFSQRIFTLKELPKDNNNSNPRILEYPKEPRVSKFCQGFFQVLPAKKSDIDLKKMARLLADLTGSSNSSPLSIKIDGHRIFKDARALIKAKTKKDAISIYSKLVGN